MRGLIIVAVILSSACRPAGDGSSTAVANAGLSELARLIADARIVDLSHAYDDKTIYWPTQSDFVFERGHNGMTDKGFYYAANSFSSPEHGGTHIDAPIHFAAGKQTVDEIPLERLIGPGIVVDVTAATREGKGGRDYLVAVSDFEAWETQAGHQIPAGAIVLLRTGGGPHWLDRKAYMGTDERGEAAVAKLHFPGLAPEAARWLVEQRSIGAIGLDTPSIDYGQSTMFEAHRLLLAANVPALENVARLEELPLEGFLVVALPMKIRGGSGGPLRAVAIVPGG